MLNGPFPPWPSFTQEEADAASAVLLSNKVNYWTGQEGREFEREFAAFAGTEYAIAVANGTLALDLALRGLGIGPGDEVVVTPRTFLASATAVAARPSSPSSVVSVVGAPSRGSWSSSVVLARPAARRRCLRRTLERVRSSAGPERCQRSRTSSTC